MSQKIFNNIILLVIIFFIIRQISPEPDSVLYILKKYVNYISFKFIQLLNSFGIDNIENFIDSKNLNKLFNLNPKVQNFKTKYDIDFINYYKKKNPNVNENNLLKLCFFLKTLKNNVNSYFHTTSDNTARDFTKYELNQIKNIILDKLNLSSFKFNSFNLKYIPKYYLNSDGKQIDPFIFNVNSEFGKIRFYIDIDIYNNIIQNKEYIIINEIKLLKNKQVIFANQNISYYNLIDENEKDEIIENTNISNEQFNYNNNHSFDYDNNELNNYDKVFDYDDSEKFRLV